MLKKIIVILVVCFTAQSFAQNKLNNYKYILVPLQYEFFEEADKYQLNSLTEFLFNKYKFTAFLEDKELPEDLLENRCLALMVNTVENKTMFKTKLKVQLINCNGQVVYTTQEGESRRKEYKSSYSEALRNALSELNKINYRYNETNTLTELSVQENSKKEKEIEKLKKEIKDLKKDKSIIQDNISEHVNEDLSLKPAINTLYAQSINNGFQLVDSTPNLVYTIYYSGKEDIYIVKNHDAIIYKLEGNWVLAEFINNKTQVKVINIKF